MTMIGDMIKMEGKSEGFWDDILGIFICGGWIIIPLIGLIIMCITGEFK